MPNSAWCGSSSFFAVQQDSFSSAAAVVFPPPLTCCGTETQPDCLRGICIIGSTSNPQQDSCLPWPCLRAVEASATGGTKAMMPSGIPEYAPVLSEKEATEALKKFVKKNRTPKDRAKFMSTPTPMPPSEETGELRPDERGPEPSMSLPGTMPGLADADASLKKLVEEKLVKFDIFDSIDEERIKDFEAAAERSKAQSNYKEYKAKNKKIDPNKFASVTVVQRREDGHSVMT
ncbi:unnamed protein product [Symbiodinium necroappetens]|uniref:Uncharacterized protein n=1 Tax=Symbiodinium necroappetens TaxID=1628268 RepID=A0A812MJZ3_9DINO|nr:unnamed protein product [Symbiodinium necroappetens]